MGSGLPRAAVASGAISGHVLRLARISAGDTQEGLAHALGVDLTTVQGWETGRRPVAHMKASDLADLRRRLAALGAHPALVRMLEPAMDADRIISYALEPPVNPDRHPLAEAVHTRAVSHMIGWATKGTPPPVLATLPLPRRGRGPTPTTPSLSPAVRQQLFSHLRGVAEQHDAVPGSRAALLRRQALYLASYDTTGDTAAWTTHMLQRRRGLLSTRGWSPSWAEARSAATALARQGDVQPLHDFIDRAVADDDTSEAANLNYWAYWLGATAHPQPDDLFMADRSLPGWDALTLLRLLAAGLHEAPGFVDLYAHTLAALLEAHPWLPLADPQACTALDQRVQAIAEESASGVLISPRSRRELSAVHYRLSNRT